MTEWTLKKRWWDRIKKLVTLEQEPWRLEFQDYPHWMSGVPDNVLVLSFSSSSFSSSSSSPSFLHLLLWFCLFHMCGCFSFMCVCAPHACSTHRGQKRASNPLQLFAEWLWALYLGAGNQNQVLKGSASALKCWAGSPPSPLSFFLCLLKKHCFLELHVTETSVQTQVTTGQLWKWVYQPPNCIPFPKLFWSSHSWEDNVKES